MSRFRLLSYSFVEEEASSLLLIAAEHRDDDDFLLWEPCCSEGWNANSRVVLVFVAISDKAPRRSCAVLFKGMIFSERFFRLDSPVFTVTLSNNYSDCWVYFVFPSRGSIIYDPDATF